ncbi:MAG: hypothetical protein ABIF71_07585 [Planctomycetota bacterium]
MKSTRQNGSVVVVSVAVLLLLSLLAVTYVTIMEIEVRSNEAYQYGMKADMIVNWFIADACALLQTSVMNVGIYEDYNDNDRPVGVWHGVGDYTSDESVYRGGSRHANPMRWQNPPHNWFMPTTVDFRRYDYDANASFMDALDGEQIFFGSISPEGRIFGEQDQWMYVAYNEFDLDILNADGDYDNQTHRQCRWRTYRNPDPDLLDTWDNIYARSAGLMQSTQAMLYLGEYRGDYTDRTDRNYVAGHVRRMEKNGDQLTQNTIPVGYNLAAYRPGDGGGADIAWNRTDHQDDITHVGVKDREDRSKLDPSPRVEGINRTTNDRRDIDGQHPGTANILDDGNTNAGSWPDITYWRGGEGMMNINALIRMLRHLVNERAAIAIAKHRPYRTKEQILQAVELEGATLTTAEYARLMANVTCHSNYDPVTGFCALNVNKLRSPQSVLCQRYMGPDPLLIAPPGKFYDRDITEYLPRPTVVAPSSEYQYHGTWHADDQLFSMAYAANTTWGDQDPDSGIYCQANAPGVRIADRLLWAAFSSIPSLVINHDPSDDGIDSYGHTDNWQKMADYAHREYDWARDRAPTISSGRIQTLKDSKILQIALGILRNDTGGKMDYSGGGSSGFSGGGARMIYGYLHPSRMVNTRNCESESGCAIGIGRALPNVTAGNRGLSDMLNFTDPGVQPGYWGWTPVHPGGDAAFGEFISPANRMRPFVRMYYGFFCESIDRFEEMIAWMGPFHPVANPHGRGVLTERQTNDILNNFIDFRDNIQNPNNLMTDWKLHSQEFDRGNYEAYRQTEATRSNGINKDGYINDSAGGDQRLNTVCSATNWTQPSPLKYPDAGQWNTNAGVKVKVPYVYIGQPYFDKRVYPPPAAGGTGWGLNRYIANALSWANDKAEARKGESVIEMAWNVWDASGNIKKVGYGDSGIKARCENITDQLFPWVNELQHQEFNIIGIGEDEGVIEGFGVGQYGDLCWVRNYNWSSLNWTKDWVAFNYHKNLHNPAEFGGSIPGVPAGATGLYAEGKRAIAAWGTAWQYYESPGLIFGPDRIPDCYQTLNLGQELVDLSRYVPPSANPVGEPERFETLVAHRTYKPIFTDLFDSDGDGSPDNGASPPANLVVGDLVDARVQGYVPSFNAFIQNCTGRAGASGQYSYGLAWDHQDRTSNLAMDADCKVMTHFGYRGFDSTVNTGGRSGYRRQGRFDYKMDSLYFKSTYAGRNGSFQTKLSSWCGFGQNITLYNKPYLFDVPMKSPASSSAPYTNVTFGYSYNYGRNIYAYDFDGSALAVKEFMTGADEDMPSNSGYRLTGSAGAPRFVQANYGQAGLVAGAGGRLMIDGTWDGYDLKKIAVEMGKANNMLEIVPRFNPVEPFFDPMYPEGRLFYRRLMTAGDTTIVLNKNYRQGAVKNSNIAAFHDNYSPNEYRSWNDNNLIETVRHCNVEYENDSIAEGTTARNPFLTDSCPRITANNPETYTDTWPMAGGGVSDGQGGSVGPDHWNHVYNSRYNGPWIIDETGLAAGQPAHLSADAPWTVPICVRDRFFEIRVKAEIISAGLATTVADWRGVEVLASKQAMAVFDRGWRWNYWDTRIDEGCPWYDPFQMVGSRPGVDAAGDTTSGAGIDAASGMMIYDNEMCTVDDWTNTGYDRTFNADQVNVGYIAPAEYSGVNRPGDDDAARARIVFFKWLGDGQ